MAENPDRAGQTEAAFVSEPGTGRMTPLPGYGALRGWLALDSRIDLTKPIYQQALRLQRAGRARKALAGRS